MDLRLNGRTAVVAGASRGIGLAVTRGLVAEGVRIAAGALKSSAELDELARAGPVRVVEVDLAAPDRSAAWWRRPAMVTGRFSRPHEVADLDWLYKNSLDA